MAAKESKSLRFWFRQRYNLAPTDRRFLSMTDDDIRLEYEACLAYEGEPLKTCPNCETKTHRKHCIKCVSESGQPLPLTGDSAIDQAMADIEAGKEVDLEKLLRGDFETVSKGKK